MSPQTRLGFWQEAMALDGTIVPKIFPLVLQLGLLAAAVEGVAILCEWLFKTQLELDVAPFEFVGAALGILLVFRTNTGYERWWEARKLWGGFVNGLRNFVIGAMAYGPNDAQWREQVVRLAAVYPHVVRHRLRSEQLSSEVTALVGQETADRIAAAEHMPSFVAMKLADLLREACDHLGMDRFAFLQVDHERALLIDCVGGCERILNTPGPQAYSTKIRHFLVLFLLSLPLTLLHRFQSEWLVPLVTMLIAYPLLALDTLGVELENPFATSNLNHLPLDDISATIEGNLMGLLHQRQADGRPG